MLIVVAVSAGVQGKKCPKFSKIEKNIVFRAMTIIKKQFLPKAEKVNQFRRRLFFREHNDFRTKNEKPARNFGAILF